MAKRIFLIDDDADDRDLFCEAITDVAPDFICYTAPDGKKGLQALSSNEHDLPDLIFLDVNMPVMNGWQFLTVLKRCEAFRRIPVIVYSTSSHLEDAQKAQAEGAFCYFTKPFHFVDLKKSLELVAHHLRSNTLPMLVEYPGFSSVSAGYMHSR